MSIELGQQIFWQEAWGCIADLRGMALTKEKAIVVRKNQDGGNPNPSAQGLLVRRESS
ncbi:MAG TPA: hypothetical protein V6D50_23845 [Chroococcales cyanobacterium]